MCIYGRFEDIHMVRNEVFHKYKRIPFSILLTAPPDDLDNRTLRRHILSETEQGTRSKEMKKQIDFIERNDELVKSGFDLIIENGDKKPVHEGQLQLTDFIRKSIDLSSKHLIAANEERR